MRQRDGFRKILYIYFVENENLLKFEHKNGIPFLSRMKRTPR